MIPGQIRDGLDNGFGILMGRLLIEEFLPEAAPHSQTLKKTTEVFLKNDDQHKKEDGEKTLKDNGGQIELEKTGCNIDGAQQADADKNEP
jgi:hypothetical protein